MVKRALTLSAVSLVAVAVTAPTSALAGPSVGIEQAEKAVRATLRGEFTSGGGVKPGSLDLTCRRDGAFVRCGIRMKDRKDRRWCGHSSVRPGPGGGGPITITRYNVRMANCARA